MRLKKLRCHETTFNLVVSLFFALVLNGLFLFRAWERIPYTSLHDYIFAASLPVVLTAAFGLIFNLVAWPYLRKPLLAVLILTSAAANYVMFSFGTVIDTNMVQNVFETDLQESTALLSRNAVIWLMLMGVALQTSQMLVDESRLSRAVYGGVARDYPADGAAFL